MSVINAAIAGVAGVASAAIGSRASSKASDAAKDASDDQVALSRDQFNRQDELARKALKKQGKINSAAKDRTQRLAGRERNDLERLAERGNIRGHDLATQVYGRNKTLLRDARDDVLGGISRDRSGTAQTLQGARNRQLAGYTSAEERNIDTLQSVRGRSLDLFRPAYDTGNNALSAYASELGLGKRPEGFKGLSLTPGAKFLMEEGRTEIEGGAAGAGGLYSGATLEALERKRMGLAATDRDNQMGQLFGLVGVGQNAAGNMAGIEQNYATGVTGQRNIGSAARGGVEADFADDMTSNTRYWNGANADAIGRYAGAEAGLNDQNYGRHLATTEGYLNNLGSAAAGYTDRSTNTANAFADRQGAAVANRVNLGANAGNSYVASASNALAARGAAGAAGAAGTASAINSGINNGFGIYGMLGGTFGNPFQQDPNALGNTQWPQSKPPMPRPA